jgi:oligopeptide transport system substrate-binding protein
VRPLLGLVAALALALAGAGLSFRASIQGPAELVFVNGTEPRTLDPGLATGLPEGRIVDALFEGLTVRDPASLRPVPGVAERWETSPDGLSWVFHLREDARWSDGEPVTAHDFAWSWRRLEDPALGSEYAYLLHGVRFAEAWNSHGAQAEALAGPVAEALRALGERHADAVPADVWRRFVAEQRLGELLRGTPDPVLAGLLAAGEGPLAADRLRAARDALPAEARRRAALHEEAARRFGRDAGVFARDARTLVVELRAPVPWFLELTAFYPTFPVPRRLVEARPRDWFLPGTLVSNGPFRLAAWRVNDRLRMLRSERYWGRAGVRLASADALPVENATTALNLYLTGAADWVPGPSYPSDLVDRLRERPDFYSHPALAVYYFRFNCRRPPLDDPRVREALAVAVDRRSIAEDVLRLGQPPALHLVPPGMPGYEPPPSRLGFDLPRARRLLAEAGFPGGKGLPELGILYNTSETHKQIAEVLADQLRRHLGLRVRAYNQEWQAYQGSVLAGDYDLARAAWVGDYRDPNTFLDLWVTSGGNNQTGWGDPRYDRLLALAADPASLLGEAALPAGLREPARIEAALAAARVTRDAAPRLAALARLRLDLLREAEAILVQEAFPVLPLHFYVVSGLVKPHVRGFHLEIEAEDGSRGPNLEDLHPLRGMWVAEGG